MSGLSIQIQLFLLTYGSLLILLVAVPIIAALLIALFSSAVPGNHWSIWVVFSVAFALLLVAFNLGYLTGSSRDGAVGRVAPAVLGSFGALASFAVAKIRVSVTLAAWATVAFTLFMMAGLFLGIQYRLADPSFNAAQEPFEPGRV